MVFAMQPLFEILKSWIPYILSSIKKEIRTEYLPANPPFCKAHFGNRSIYRLSFDEMIPAVEKELLSGDETLAEWVIQRWVFRHGDLYEHFAQKLGEICPDFDALTALSEEQSAQVLSGAEGFGAIDLYLFARLNRVVFPDSVFETLRLQAEKAHLLKREEQKKGEEKQNLEQILERQQRDFARLEEKYESRLAGVQRKYATDIEALKKQIRALQRQLNLSQ